MRKSRMKELAEIHAPECVTIYIDTHQKGQEVTEYQDRLRLKNQIREAEHQLYHFYQMKENVVKEYMRPIYQLLDDTYFWHHQDEGLVIFRNENIFEYYTLPVKTKNMTYVADHFYMLPVFDLFNEINEYYLLLLTLKETSLLKVHAFDKTEKEPFDKIFSINFKDVVGEDYEQKSLQMRSQQEGNSRPLYHGQGYGIDDQDKEILKYFKSINQQVVKKINHQSTPLIVACADHMFNLYCKNNDYPGMLDKHMSGNYEHANKNQLLSDSYKIIREYLNQQKKETVKSYSEISPNYKTPLLEDILNASVEGKVKHLFIDQNHQIWGRLDLTKQQTEVHHVRHEGDAELINLAARQAFLNGGNIFLVSPDEKPETSAASAILRY